MYQQQASQEHHVPAAEASVEARGKFIEQTYLHLALAIAAFVGLESVLVNLPGVDRVTMFMIDGYNWLAVLGAFMLVSWIADRWARSSVSLTTQYLGLGLYVVAEAVIFVPLVYLARELAGSEILVTAATITMAMFATLTLYVFVTKRNFSFMRGMLGVAGMVAIGLIVGSIVFGFSLGLIFSVAMIALASGYILYYTSNVLHHYRPGQHVAAALTLFSAIALLFWYVLRLLMALRR